MQHLQGHHCAVGGIPGPVHRALAPRGYLLQYLVPAYGLLLQFTGLLVGRVPDPRWLDLPVTLSWKSHICQL